MLWLMKLLDGTNVDPLSSWLGSSRRDTLSSQGPSQSLDSHSAIQRLYTGQTWTSFQRVPELFILVPILLNLKGNIEMNLAARFSTSANIGELDIRLTRQTLVFGNLALLQVQALLVSLLAGLIAFILGLLSRVSTPASTTEIGGYFECVTVLVASMLAAGLSSAVVGSFMCALVVLSRKWRINPVRRAFSSGLTCIEMPQWTGQYRYSARSKSW